MIFRKISITFFLLCFTAACTLSHHDLKAVDMRTAVPETYAETPDNLISYIPDTKWWITFNDNTLNQLMEDIFNENADIATAVERVRQMASVVSQSSARKYPHIGLEGSGSTGVTTPEGNRIDGLSASLSTQYEIDIWGKIKSEEAAAILEKEATEEEMKSLLLTVSSQAAILYFNLIEQTAQLQAMNEQIRIYETICELLMKRYKLGLASSDDYYEAEALLEQLRSSKPVVSYNIKTIRSALAVLCGRFSWDNDIPEKIDPKGLPALFPEGLPSDILFQRPDIQASFKAVQIKDIETAVAIRDRFPSVNLAASFGFAENSGEIPTVSGTIYNLAAGMAMPVIDFGSRRAAVRQKEAAFREACESYKKSVLTAFMEIENALMNNRSVDLRHVATRVSLEQLMKTDQYVRSRYRLGMEDYLAVLKSAYSLSDRKRTLLSVENEVCAARVELASAIGGAWLSDEVERRIASANPENKEHILNEDEVGNGSR